MKELLMREIQLDSGPSSSATHHLTQSSTTLNRRYVDRPSNLAIEEAAHSSIIRQGLSAPDPTPSRLVNLRVHADEITAAQTAATSSLEPEPDSNSYAARPNVIHNVIELGSVEPTVPRDFHAFIPEEDSEAANLTSEIATRPSAYSDTYSAPATIQHIETTSITTVAPEPSPSATLPASASFDSESLAMNIAADYAAASLGASLASRPDTVVTAYAAPEQSLANLDVSSSASIDAIASAVSEAIAAIRTATEPTEIADQIESLQNFAENLRNDASSPEMLELSDTIEKFLNVVSKSTKVKTARSQKPAKSSKSVKPVSKSASSAAPRRATSNPARPIIKSSAKPAHRPLAAKRGAAQTAAPAPSSRTTTRPTARRAARPLSNSGRISPSEDQALRQALRSVTSVDEEETSAPTHSRSAKPFKRKTNGKRLVLAFTCATACVAAIVYFVGSSIPDISVRVAAIQTGIEASTPSYIPRDYSLSDISSEDGKITLTFKGPDDASFTLIEEKSSWDSSTLLRAYVEPTWKDSYTSTHEQGITIYMSGSNAAWVNGGILYKINAPSNILTKKQLRNIVTSI